MSSCSYLISFISGGMEASLAAGMAAGHGSPSCAPEGAGAGTALCTSSLRPLAALVMVRALAQSSSKPDLRCMAVLWLRREMPSAELAVSLLSKPKHPAR